jgi:membrane-associated protein
MELIELIKSVGYIGVWSIIFTETGILFGILLPGDTLLFAVGVLAAQGVFNIWWMSLGCFLAAFIGNLVGYWIGAKFGLPFVRKYCGKLITQDHIDQTEKFYERYGKSGIVVARFVPVARTVAPFLAGVIKMDLKIYTLYSALGALVWAVGLPLLGYMLGDLIPPHMIDLFIIPIIVIIIAIVAWPYVKNWWKNRQAHKNESE